MKKLLIMALMFLSVNAFATTEVNVSVNGMVCGFCAQGISKKFSKEPSVDTVKVNLENKRVILKLKDGKELSDDQINAVLKDAGYSVSKIDRKKE